MPLGWERINAKTSQPNKNIAFIKPRPGPDENTSKDFLERIASQCLPIMNRHYLAVASLEEYEPNREFWGRNFNHGEVIQLVLKSPSTGRWLPFKFVQMVMMHELAHIKQMNHSKAFWAIKNEFSTEMRVLWDKGYTGDGLWGRGMLLMNGAFEHEQLGEGEELPKHMCGGSFVSRGGRKRKLKPKITYKEQKERRIRKKFGANGVTLGADEVTKVKLEKGKKPLGKPRVAGSARGRELRAAAALSRFEVTTEDPKIKDEDLVTDSETESDTDSGLFIKTEPNDAIDINGQKLLDTEGKGMVKVCEDGDKDDEDAKRELRELQALGGSSQVSKSSKNPISKTMARGQSSHSITVSSAQTQAKQPESTQPSGKLGNAVTRKTIGKSSKSNLVHPGSKPEVPIATAKEEIITAGKKVGEETFLDNGCPVCSVENDLTSLTCCVCSNVLRPEFVLGTWKCQSAACDNSKFLNPGDAGVCGVCGARKNSY